MPDRGLEIGRVLGPRGLRGELRIRLFRIDPALLEGGRLTLRPRVRPLEEQTFAVHGVTWMDPNTASVRLEGITSRTDAEAWERAIAVVDPSWFVPGGPTPIALLIGARVFEEGTGRPVGAVGDIDHNGAQHVLVIDGDDGEERLVPMVDALVRIAPGEGGAREVHVQPIPGLLAED